MVEGGVGKEGGQYGGGGGRRYREKRDEKTYMLRTLVPSLSLLF